MQLHELKSPLGSRKRRKIVGRGPGSGHGKTSGRGNKGQSSRAGRDMAPGLEGGQIPLIRRLPKVGFNSRWPNTYQIVDLEYLNRFADGTIIDIEKLKQEGLIKSLNRPVKILSNGSVTKKLIVKVNKFSKTAAEKIKKAGGTAEVI